ncbi:zinc finger protein 506-like [Belonocnema kinseyi]|uniref:zinc finger protein 506-like n=1 Tax=Belonocnema kinseyi TaxID=2817044 RepID=UPI00143DE17C|nr:zinc finger protein 506-like [Belonocnema kinseyi]
MASSRRPAVELRSLLKPMKLIELFHYEDYSEVDMKPSDNRNNQKCLKCIELKRNQISESDSKKIRIRSTAHFFKYQREDHNPLLPKDDEGDFTCKIEYNNDETLEIKEEIIEDYENFSNRGLRPSDNRKYQSKVFKIHQSKTKPRTPDANVESENKFKCEKCARRYRHKKDLTYHQKFECDVMRQFNCKFCGKLFKRISHMNRHVDVLHRKKKLKISEARHNCDKCFRSYAAMSSLNRHKRMQHEGIYRQFICDICDYKSNDKVPLLNHILSRHLK